MRQAGTPDVHISWTPGVSKIPQREARLGPPFCPGRGRPGFTCSGSCFLNNDYAP